MAQARRRGRKATQPVEEPDRERRISDEIIVDAYDEDERATGWYCHLQDTIAFPFAATCVAKRAISPLCPGDEIEILGMAPEEECAHEVFVMTRWERDGLAVPLSQVAPHDDAVEETVRAVEDWAFWVRMGYRF